MFHGFYVEFYSTPIFSKKVEKFFELQNNYFNKHSNDIMSFNQTLCSCLASVNINNSSITRTNLYQATRFVICGY